MTTDALAAVHTVGVVDSMRARFISDSELVRIVPRNLQHPFWLRPATTDFSEVIGTVARGAYGAYLPSGPVTTIIDAGANCGDTTAWYLSRFPQARVIALEPEDSNFEMLFRNCSPYGGRAKLLKAALWPTSGHVRISGSSKNAFTVDDGEEIQAASMPELIGLFDISVIDILKLDIEGAETQVFSQHDLTWLEIVRCMVIELHGAHAESLVKSAATRYGFRTVLPHRNLTYFFKGNE